MLLQGGLSAAVHAALLFSFFSPEPAVVLAFNLDTGHVIRKHGEPGSLFGFSLALHRQINPDKMMMLIGAPRARALGKQTANITGGLYKCEITMSSGCERIEFDNEEDTHSENKENQWMGVTVQSQGPGGKIVTCAHRYQRRLFVNTPQESHDITGRCYVLSQDLTIDSSSDEDGGNWNFCQGRARGHEMFGSCQQGLAATFTKDYHYVVFGAPGAYNWKGIVRVEQKNTTLLEMEVYDDGPYEVGNEQSSNPELVPVPANSYLGFSLDSGHRITKSRGLTVVAGAPRANHSGAVVLLKKESQTSTRLLVEHTLHGPGLASSFGYDVAVVDLNGDGWEDIVVGAPQFYMKDRDVGGAVYVYINKAGRWERITPVRLNGTKHSMFGLAVENAGDINQDSYEDIAVGAPHDDAGTGKVYIYHGSAQGIKTSPAQVEHNIRFFGYSLAGNMDLDGNSYPDLAVVNLTPTDIYHKACFAYKANPASYSPKLTIGYFVEADGVRRKQGLPSRVVFLNKSRSEFDYQFNGTIDLRGQGQESCIMIKARLKDNIKDKMRSIPVEVSPEIIGAKRQKIKNGLPQLMPILDSSRPSKVITEVNFIKEGCGIDHICRSNLKMEYSLYYKQNNMDVYLPLNNSIPEFLLSYENKNLALRVTVNNMNGDDAYEAKVVASFPDTLSYSGVRSHQTTTEKPIICTANQNGSQADCDLGNPFKRDSQVQTCHVLMLTLELVILIQTTSVQENIAPVKVKAKVIIELPLSVTGEASPSQVSFGGVVKGESAMGTEEEIGSLINYTFRINNLWKSVKPSAKAFLHIQWPRYNKDGKWLLYLVKITAKGPENIVCSPHSEIDSLQLTQTSPSRTKREIVRKQRKTGGKVSHLSGKKKVLVSLSINKNCVVLRCPLQGLDGTSVELRSRLWNSTFIEVTSCILDVFVRLFTKNVILRTPDTTVTVTVSPDSPVAQYLGVPWWIILVAVLAGVLILALLVFLLWKCGFFKRSKQDDSVPRYHAVRIRKETPECKDGKVKLDAFDKKQWMTTWINNESYS
uniref:Integrin alpha-2 domain-containing protein n=1 Tax=Amphiprion ocellaris TaxID=80972 RepID=A0AAQ5YNH0_AMPOC